MDKRIIRTQKYLLCIGLILCIGVIVAAVYFFNSLFPKAEPISLPQNDDVISISVRINTSDMTIPMSENDIDRLFEYLREGKPTRQQALNDYPTERLYYDISIQTSEREYCYFIYETDGQTYIEVPYEGIYEAKTELLNLVLTYFQEG